MIYYNLMEGSKSW